MASSTHGGYLANAIGSAPKTSPVRARALVGIALIALLVLLASPGCVSKGGTEASVLKLEVGNQPSEIALGLQLAVVLTILSLVPAIVIMLTSFTRAIIVLSFTRNAIGVPQMPPNQILVGLALFLTVFVMAPVWNQINTTALEPYTRGDLPQEAALQRGMEPIRQFMFKQTREKDLSLFVFMAKMERPRSPDGIPTHVLIPAFIISELKTGFQMGFIVFIPFLIIDMVIASVLMSMGMVMLPPVVISLPFKILLFVLVDGWHLIVKSLLVSFG